MSEINYQALREVAERAIPAMERLLMLPADDDLLSEQELKDYGVDIDALNAFKFLAGPETVLALLDERERNQQYIKRRDQENEDIALTGGISAPSEHQEAVRKGGSEMRKLKIIIETGIAGGDFEDEFEVDDDATPDEIQDEAKDIFFNYCNYSYHEIKDEEEEQNG